MECADRNLIYSPENFHFHCTGFHEPNRHFTAVLRDRKCRCSHESAKDCGSSDGSVFTLLGAV